MTANNRRRSGLPVLASVPWGAHVCHFYETREDVLDTVLPFIATGLEDDEFCLWVTADPITPDDARAALRAVVPDLDRHFAAEHVAVVSYDQWYPPPEEFDLSGVIRGWIELLEDAERRGCAGMRVAAHTGWVPEGEWRDFGEYEAELDRAIAARRMVILCAYPLHESSAAQILDVTQTHESAIVRRQGRWEVLESPRLKQAKEELARLKDDLERRVVERTQQLAVANRGLEREILERNREIAERKTAEAERGRYASQLRDLASASVAINPLASVDEVLRLSTERARSIVGADRAVTIMTDDSGEPIVHTASPSDDHGSFRDFAAELDGTGYSALVVRTNRPLRLTQHEVEAQVASRGFGAFAGPLLPLRGWIGVPLIGRDGRNLGLIQLSDKAGGDFTSADEAILVQLAQITAIAIENVRLFDELQQKRVRLQSLSRRLVAAEEDERRRIARELHDEIGQALTALKVNLETMRHQPDDWPTLLAESIMVADRTLHQVRDLSLDLRPSLLDDLGLIAALRWYIDRQSRRAGWRVNLRGDPLAQRPPPEIETVCFRVVQEALTNVMRHAAATHIWVELQARDGELRLSIRDDGVGFDVSAARERALAGASLGLLGMQERVELVGGTWAIRSQPGGGTSIEVRLPVVVDRASGTEGST